MKSGYQSCLDKLQIGDRIHFIWKRTGEEFTETIIKSDCFGFISRDTIGFVRPTYYNEIIVIKIYKAKSTCPYPV